MNSISSINALQELSIRDVKKQLPKYSIENIGSITEPKFLCRIEIEIHGQSIKKEAIGRTKKEAKHKAAENVLIILGHQHYEPLNKQDDSTENFIGNLNVLASTRRKSYPVYIETFDMKSNSFVVTCQFEGNETVGSGTNKKKAKQKAAQKMLSKVSTGVQLQDMPKKLKKDEIDLRAMNKFEELCRQKLVNKTAEEQTISKSSKNEISTPKIVTYQKKFDYSLEEAMNIIGKEKMQFNLVHLQRSPKFVIVLEIKGVMTVMGSGITEEEAKISAFSQAIKINSLTKLKDKYTL